MSRIPIRLSSPSKYRAKRTAGYASCKEGRRAGELELLERLGEIRNLRKQANFELIPRQPTNLLKLFDNVPLVRNVPLD